MTKSRRSTVVPAVLALAAFLLTPSAAAPAEAQTAPVCEDIPGDSYFPGWILLQTSPHSIDESAGETAVTITAEINGPALDRDTTVALWGDWESSVFPQEGVDFTFREDELPTITIPAGEVRGCATIHIDPIEDNIDEGDGEHLAFEGTHSGGKLVLASSGLWINDNDTVSKVVNLEITDWVDVIAETDCRGLRLAQTSVGTVLTSRVGQCLHLPVYVKARLSGSVAAGHDVTVTFDNTLRGTARGILFQRSVTEQQASAYDYIYTAGIPASWSLTIPAGSLVSPAAAAVHGAFPFILYPIDDAVQDGLKTIDVWGSLGPLLSGNGWRVNPATISLQDDESRPAAPTNLRLEPIEGPRQGQVGKMEEWNRARLQWTAPDTSTAPAQTSYRLERQIPYDHEVSEFHARSWTRYPSRLMYPAAGATSYLDRMPVFSNDYSWVLYAVNENGETASNRVSLENVSNPAPQQPGGM